MFRFDERAFDSMIRRVQQLGPRARQQAREAAERTGRDVLAASRPLVPVETGELRDSGTVIVEETSDGAAATVVYTASHAAAVHENLEAVHKVGRAKFLEGPLVDSSESSFAEHGPRALRRAAVEE